MSKKKNQEKSRKRRDSRVKEQLARRKMKLREEAAHKREMGRLEHQSRPRLEPFRND